MGVVTHWPPQPESFNPFPGERSTVPQGKCKSEWEVGPPNGHHRLGTKVSLSKEHKFGLVEKGSYIQWAEKWHRALWDLARKWPCRIDSVGFLVVSEEDSWEEPDFTAAPSRSAQWGRGGDWLPPPVLCKGLLWKPCSAPSASAISWTSGTALQNHLAGNGCNMFCRHQKYPEERVNGREHEKPFCAKSKMWNIFYLNSFQQSPWRLFLCG